MPGDVVARPARRSHDDRVTSAGDVVDAVILEERDTAAADLELRRGDAVDRDATDADAGILKMRMDVDNRIAGREVGPHVKRLCA
jgi:hypothetical protein